MKEGDVFLDIGAGSGYFTFPAAGILGNQGRIISIDSSSVMIEELKRKAIAKGYHNIDIRLSQEYELNLKNEKADIAFMSLVLHDR